MRQNNPKVPDMEDHPLSNTFTWKIKIFSENGRRLIHSTLFSAIGYKWYIVALADCIGTGYLSIYLLVSDFTKLPYGWSRSAEIRLSLINQIDSNMAHTKEAQHEFNSKDRECCFTKYISLSKLNDPKEGYFVNGTCIIEAVVAVPRSDHKRKRVTLQQEAITIPDVKIHQRIPLFYGANSRTTPVASPPSNLTRPSSTLKKRSKIACTILNGFMLEFAEDFPTLEKFGQVMEDIRATMYGGKMGDIFEEWRPRILEIEGLLADIEDMEQQSEALQSGALFKLEESLADVRQAILEKWKEFKSAETKAAPAEKLKALKEIKKLNQQEGDAITKTEDVVTGAEESKMVIAEKKAKIVEWLSNPFHQQHS